ncbi:hypothetical protein ABC357_12680 [Bacillus sp. 1P06AnD]
MKWIDSIKKSLIEEGADWMKLFSTIIGKYAKNGSTGAKVEWT